MKVTFFENVMLYDLLHRVRFLRTIQKIFFLPKIVSWVNCITFTDWVCGKSHNVAFM